MRFAKYFLVLVAITILAIGIIGVGVGFFDQRPTKTIVSRKPAGKVFVDIDQLIAGHPSLEALRTIDSTIAGVRVAQSNALRVEAMPRPETIPIPVAQAKAGVPRWELEAITAQQADESLQQLKVEQLMALQGRIQASRKTMLDSAEADILAMTREIEQATAVKITAITKRCGYDVVNLQLRAKTLRSMLGKPGVNGAEINRKLALVETELARYQSNVQAETQQVADEAEKGVAELRKTAVAKIDTAMSAYGRSETLKIQKRIDDALSQIMADVVSFDQLSVADLFGGKSAVAVNIKSLGVPTVGAASVFNANADLALWRTKADALKQRIRNDVVSEVRALAEERNVRVVFSRRGRGLPDETALFEKLIWNRQTRKGMPILYGDNGI